MRHFHLFGLFASLVFRSVFCALVNVSIDDTHGDEKTGNRISYSPDGAWSPNACPGCTVSPDPTKAFGNTWQFAAFAPSDEQPVSATVGFTGVAVYVICILTGSLANPNGNSDMTFFLDGSIVGTFDLPPDGDASYQYDHVVFSAPDLQAGVHTIKLESGLNGTQALVLLDRIIYTADSTDFTSSSSSPSTALSPNTSPPSSSNPSPSSSSSSSHGTRTGTIVGAILGAIGGVALVCIVLWWILLRKRRRRATEEMQAGNAVEPFVDRPPAGPGSASAGTWSETAATAAPSSDVIAMNVMTSPIETSRHNRPDRIGARAADYAAPSHGSGSSGSSAKVKRTASTVAVVSHSSPSTASGSSTRNGKRALRDQRRTAQANPSQASSQPSASTNQTLVPSAASGSAGSPATGRGGSRPLPAPPSQRTRERRGPDEDPEETARYHRKILDSMSPSRHEPTQNPPAPPPAPPETTPVTLPIPTRPTATEDTSTSPQVSSPPVTLPPRFRGGSSVVGSDVSAGTAPPPYGSSEVGRPQQ